MSQSPDSHSSYSAALSPAGGAEAIRDGLRGKYVCPFCGSVNDSEQGMCPRCTMENSAATRKATKTRIGPWYVLQTRNPAAPGMTWDTLLSFIRKGRVKPRSIVRGPTTHQLWRFAAQVKGLSREFGICYSCGSGIEANASLCPTCNRLQEPPPNPDALLEASRDAQMPAYATPPATIDGNVLAAAGPATVMGQTLPGSLSASPPAVVAPPANEGDFVIPALGSGAPPAKGAAAGRTPAGLAGNPGVAQTVSRGAANGPATPPAGPAVTNAPSRGRSQQQTPPATQMETPAVPYTGLTGDTSWAKIPETPKEKSAARDRGQRQPRVQAGTATAGGQAFNPYAADDDAGARRNEGDSGFLSAKDLAAAFNLGFVGEEEDVPVQRTVRGPAAAAANAGVPNAPGFGGQRAPSKFRAVKVIFALLLLAAAVFGVAVAVKPELYDQVKATVQEQIENLSKQTEGDKLGDQPRKQGPTSKNPTPATRPARDPDGDTGAPIPGANAADTARPANTDPAKSPGSDLPPAQQAFNDALDAEENGDNAKALSLLRKIKIDYPRDEWPTVLDTVIRRVEARLGDKSN